MSKNSNRPGSGGNEFPIFAGILLGIVMGLAIAGGIAWFVLKKNVVPAPTTPKEQIQTGKPSTPEKPSSGKPAAAGTSSGANNGKARFEFYKELTDKPDTSASKKPDRSPPVAIKADSPAKTNTKSDAYFLQEGSYTTTEDAEKVKAKLALLGMVANIQQADIPEKGVRYRVRLGPYKSSTEMNEALASLKSNGLNALPIHAK